jgi:hypothetical protein
MFIGSWAAHYDIASLTLKPLEAASAGTASTSDSSTPASPRVQPPRNPGEVR